MKNMFLPSSRRKQSGITLIELIVVILFLGVAASIAAAGFTALRGMGTEPAAVDNAQKAQQRLELILFEKRKVGFPNPDSGLAGPDPCTRYGLDPDEFPACGNELNVDFTPYDNTGSEIAGAVCTNDTDFQYCRAEVTAGSSRPFVLHLYDHQSP